VSAPEGLWLNGAAGLVRLDLRAAAAGAAVPAQVFDEADGLRGRAEILQVGTLARAADGRIWVSTAKGVFWLDPAALRPETVPNRPTLLRATVDGRTHDTGQPLHLPPSPQRTAFAFAAAALAMPERLRYRYRLEGYDRAWQEAGAATEAVYTGLPPGDYRFVVQAFNGAGQAGPASRPLAVRVEATLAQTLWFRAACLLAGAAALWIMYRYRQAMRERRLLALEVARHAERDRIARELHDTLLQGVQGLMFRLDAASAGLPPQEPLRRELDAALVQAGTVVAEARDRVRDLRALDRGGADLAMLLAREVARIGAEFGQACRFEAHGAPAVVADDAADACVRIVAEGVRNACRHAGARRIDVVLAQGGGGSTVTVADDGRGIDPDLLRDGRPGHWGLAGMRERAAAIGARFAIRSTPGRGTVLTLELPR
jgi:signal transduction histidine kinase